MTDPDIEFDKKTALLLDLLNEKEQKTKMIMWEYLCIWRGNVMEKYRKMAQVLKFMKQGSLKNLDTILLKKFTKMNYESHLHECKLKHKEKKNNTFLNKPNIGLMNNPSSPSTRQPTMPAVNYGGFSKKPNFNLKFGKH